MRCISLFFSLLIIFATIPDTILSTPSLQTKIDNHIAFLIGKNNVCFAKKVILAAIITPLGWLTARYLLQPYLKYKFHLVEETIPWSSETRIGNGFVTQNKDILKNTELVSTEIPAGRFKSFWQTFFLITKYEKDGKGCQKNWKKVTINH